MKPNLLPRHALHLLACLCLLAAGRLHAASTVLYVGVIGRATTVQDGSSWDKGCSIDAALLKAGTIASAAQPVEIWIPGGMYYPFASGFQLSSHVRLLGGFAGNETSSDQRDSTHPTILSGDTAISMVGAVTDVNPFPTQPADINDPGWKDNVSNVLVGKQVTDVVLDGLTITGGSAMDPRSTISSTDLDSMEVFAGKVGDTTTLVQTAVPVSPLVAGGGLFFTAAERTDTNAPADLTISRCVFARNRARGYGGALVLRDAVVNLSTTVFDANVSDLNGGAISALNSTLNTQNCVFTNNVSAAEAGAVDLSSYPTLTSLAASGDQPAANGGPGSDRDKLRVAISNGITLQKLVKKGITKALTPSIGPAVEGIGAKIKAAIPNPFADNLKLAQRAEAAYDLLSSAVSAIDAAVELAEICGVSKDDPNIKRWNAISEGFKQYGTPAGLISLGLEQLAIGINKVLEHYGVDTEIPALPMSRTEVKRLELTYNNPAAPSYFVSCYFTGNTTRGEGGAIFNVYSNLWVEGCQFSNNNADTSGGAISASGYVMPRIIGSVFQGNRSIDGASAVANTDHASSQVLNCTFYQNTCTTADGYALDAQRGASVRVSNSVFWGNVNADPANLIGGADVYAATAATLDADTKKAYDSANGYQVDYVGTMQLKNCDVQSLSRIPLGERAYILDYLPDDYTSVGPRTIDTYVAQFNRLDENGETEVAGIVNSREGVRGDLRDAAQANFSADPMFAPGTVDPTASSPLIDKGSDARASNCLGAYPILNVDVDGQPRRVGGSIDVGAVEVQPAVVALIETAQPGNPDWTLKHVFVKPTATGDGSGSSWANATDQLAKAIHSTAAEVWVAAGTYKPAVANRDLSFILAEGTKVYGGFAGTETTRDQRNWKVNQTIFSGDLGSPGYSADNSRHLVTCADVDSFSVLDGIYFQDSNSADSQGTDDYSAGGAVAALRSYPTITNCVFQRNRALQGGAVWSHGATVRGPTITGCEFYNNTAEDSGGALFYDSSAWVTNCRFSGNQATTGGALAVTAGGYCIVQQSLLWGNSSSRNVGSGNLNMGYGGAIFTASDAVTIAGSTIYGNNSYANVAGRQAGGGGVYYAATNIDRAYITISNSILTQNTAVNVAGSNNQSGEQNQLSVASTEKILFDHCVVQSINRYIGAASAGNLDADPQFTAPSKDLSGDFTLKGNSCAINAGTANGSYVLPTDLLGAARVRNGGLDIGPFEYVGAIPAGGIGGSVATNRTTTGGQTVRQFTVTLPAGSSGFQWQVDRGDGVWVTLSADGVFSGVGTNTLTITGAPFSENGWRFRLAYNAPGFSLTYYSAATQLRLALPVIYVKAGASGTANGSSWTNAYSNLSDALDAAEAGSQVWVAAGTYYATKTSDPRNAARSLSLRSGIALYGGFAGTESQLSQRNLYANRTILSGKLSTLTGQSSTANTQTLFSNGGSSLASACDNTAVLDGFTLSDAAKYGVYNDGSSPTIRNCVFSNNTGPAIFDWNNSSPFIGNSEFRSNTAPTGAALYQGDGSAVIENCLFADNVSTTAGGYGGAVDISGRGNSTLTNCTFANNSAVSKGAALVVTGSGSVALRNSVVWGNRVADARTAAEEVAIVKNATLTFASDCLQGATSAANGCFTLEPLFLDPANGNYQTARISPLRNAASPTYPTVSSTDLLGNGRNSSGVDIGAYEATDGAILGPSIASLPPATVKVKTTGSATASFSVVLAPGSNEIFYWQVNLNDGKGWVNASNGGRYAITTDGPILTLTITGIGAGDDGIQARIVNPNYGNYASPGSKITVIVPTILYVNGAATGGANNGRSWTDAYTDLAAALKVATEQNEVWVAWGTYTATNAPYTLPTNVEIYGGFAGGETTRSARDWTANPTILHTVAGQPMVSCRASGTGVAEIYSALDGFVLEGGTTAGAADVYQRAENFVNCVFQNNVVGVVNKNASPTFTNCVFTGGTSSAVRSTGADATFANCRFQNFTLDTNTSVVSTVGYGTAATGGFTDCVFSNNHSRSCLYASSANLIVTRCQFLDNAGYYGGAIENAGALTVESSLFARNTAVVSGSGVYNNGGTVQIQNSTFADNSAGYYGAAVADESNAADITLLNCILWGNRVVVDGGRTAPALETQQIGGRSGQPNVTYCIVEGLSSLTGQGNQKYSPLFVNEGSDYHLNPASPAINAAQRTASTSNYKDLDGNPRYFNYGQDIGAYELQGPKSSTVYLAQSAQSVSAPVLSGVTFTFEGSSTSHFNFTWQVFDPATQTWQNVDPNSTQYRVVNSGEATSLVIASASLDLNGATFRVRELPNLPVTLTVRPPQIYYVDGGVGASGDGKSWAGAFRTVQEAVYASVAISAANSAEIWVKKGTYPVGTASTPLAMSWQVQLYGGFAGTETSRAARNWVANVTTLVSAGSAVTIEDRGYYGLGSGNSLLDGFTISDAPVQTGYFINNSSPTIRNCVFTDGGMGVYVAQNANPVIQGCTFQNLHGTALWSGDNSFTVDHCTFQNTTNTQGTIVAGSKDFTITASQFTGNSGGSMLAFNGTSSANATVSHCVFTGNTTFRDLISLDSTNTINIDNSLIADNQTTNGSVIGCDGSTVNVNFCTIANNRHQRSAIGVRSTSQVKVNCSILWGNRNTLSRDERQSWGIVDLTTMQACVLSGANGAQLTVYRGVLEGVQDAYTNENLGYDPQFTNAAAGDYSLRANSPAVNRGIGELAAPFGSVDLAGNKRVYPAPSGSPDCGAYEYQSAAAAPLNLYGDYVSKRTVVGTTVSFSFTGPNDPVQWQVNTGGGFVNLAAGNGVTIGTNNPRTLTLANVGLGMSGYQYRFVIGGAHPYTSPALTLTVVSKPVRYVNLAATGTGDGTSWENAYPSLLTALSDITTNNDRGNPEITAEIWVAGGTYNLGDQTGEISRGVEIYGGFAGGETVRTARNSAANVTTITGQTQLFTYTDNPDSIYGDPVVDGLTLGNAPDGIVIFSGNLAVQSCRFVNLAHGVEYLGAGVLKVMDSTFSGGTGHALMVFPRQASQPGAAVVQRCRFENGTDASVYVGGGALTLVDTTFQNNASLKGSSPCVLEFDARATVSINRCQFLGNTVTNYGTSVSAGAIEVGAGTMTIRQSLFAGNSGRNAGAIVNEGTLALYGVTAADNVVASTDGAGAVFGALTARNCVFWGNTAVTTYGSKPLAQVVTSQNMADVQNTAMENAYLVSGAGSLGASYDPRFVGGGDYRLQASSPYINQGNATAPGVLSGETDLAGNPRTTSGKTDLGAYQNGVSVNPIALTRPPGAITRAAGQDIVLTFGVAPTNVCAWQYSDDGGLTWKSISQLPAYITSSVAAQDGLNTLTLSGVPLSLSGYQFRLTLDGQSFATAPIAVTVVLPDPIYVDATAPAGGDGRTWTTAYQSLDTALGVVTQARRILYVAEGVYVPATSFRIYQRMEIYGGYPAGGDTISSPRDPVAHPTVLSGAIPGTGSRRDEVVSIYGGNPYAGSAPVIQADTILDGLTIQDGKTGINATFANPTLRNLLVQGNTAGGLSAVYLGGSIEDCRFLGNSGYGGAGASFSVSTVMVSRCVFQDNVATGYGGGVAISTDPSSVRLANCVISGNVSTGSGGGLSIYSASPAIENCVITGNRANAGGGGVDAQLSSAFFLNTILWGNRSGTGTTAAQQSGQGVLEAQQIVQPTFTFYGGGFHVLACDIEGVSRFAGSATGADPLFVTTIDASDAPTLAGNFHLNPSSSLLNTGVNAYSTATTDLDGKPRFYGTIDLGAYEYQGEPDAVLTITRQPQDLVFSRLPNAVNQFSVELAATTFTYQWEISTDGANFTSLGGDARFGGAQTSTLTVLVDDPALDGTLYRCKVTAPRGGVAHSQAARLTVHPLRFYVDSRATNDTGNGLTWATAMKSLSRACRTAQIDPVGVEIWVAAGTYVATETTDTSASFVLHGGLSLYGGFAGNETVLTARNPALNTTVLSGSPGIYAVVGGDFSGSDSTRLDGFSITQGNTGLAIGAGADVEVVGCTFTNLNTGIYKEAASVTIQNCRFIGNDIGIYGNAGTLAVSDSAFVGNNVGLFYYSGEWLVQRSEFRANKKGGLSLSYSGGTVENSLFSGNSGSLGSGINSGGSDLTVRNCTIAGNYATYGAAGVYANTGHVTITNSILWGNDTPDTYYAHGYLEGNQANFGQAVVDLRNNSVQGSGVRNGIFQAAQGNVNIDPGFAQAVAASPTPTTNGDYRLTSLSPLVNQGSNASPTSSATDLARNPRVYGAAIDLGAYEFQSAVLTITSQPVDATTGSGVPAHFSVATNAGNASYQWQVSSDGGATFANVIDSANEQGASTTVLTVAGLPAYDGRKYRVHVTTPQPGDVISSVATYHYLNVSAQSGFSLANATLTGLTSSAGFTLPGRTIDPTSVTENSFAIHAMETGRLSLQSGLTVAGDSVILNSTAPYKAGELVEVTVTAGVRDTVGYHVNSFVYQFHAGSTSRYGIFPGTQTVANVPAGASALALGDLNGDGSIDLVVGGSNGATILLNNGNFQFTTGQTVGTGAVAKAALGSFGFPGATSRRLDLVLVKGDGTVEIWKNNGDGTFAQSQTLAGVSGKAVAVGDLNADGALDLFLATTSGDQVWLNNGSGTFVDSQQRFGTAGGVSVAVGDLNNDGTLDAVVANGASNLEVWYNNGAGVFTAGPFSSQPSPADRVILADVDRNGILDMLTLRAGSPVSFWLNGQGSWSNAQRLSGTDGGSAGWASVDDVDGDGRPDLIAASAYDGTLTLRRGTGLNSSNGFVEFPLLAEQPALSISGVGDLADLDGDGRMDLVSVSSAGVVQVAPYQVIDQTVPENGSVALTAAAFQTIYDGTPKYGTGRTLSAIQITSLPARGTLQQNGANVTVGQVIPTGSLALAFVPATNTYGFDSFAWQGSGDGTNFGTELYRDNVLVSHVPQSVQPQPDQFTVQQGGSVSGNVLTNDGNGDPLTAKVLVPPAHGTVTMSADGSFVYTHDGSKNPHADQFTYQVMDTANNDTATAVASFTITNHNDPPTDITIAFALGYEKDPVGSPAGILTAADPDVAYDGDAITFGLVPGALDNALFRINTQFNQSLPPNSVYLDTNAVFNYTDSPTRQVMVRATDSHGLYIDRVFTVPIRSLPVATAQSINVLEDGSLNITPTGACPDGRPITGYTVTGNPQHGTVTVNGVVVTYLPSPLYWGQDAFTFTVTDGNRTSAPATISINVTHVNHAPTVNPLSLAVTENTPLDFTVTGSDPDNDPLTFQIIGSSYKGVISGTSPHFTFTPATDQTGDFQFVLVAHDGTADSPSVSLTGTISTVDYPPVLYPMPPCVVLENGSAPITLSAGDRNRKPLTYRLTAAPTHGTITGTGAQVVYQPAKNYYGTDSFQFVANNGVYDSAVGTVAIQVLHTDQPPVAAAQQVSTSQLQPVGITLAAQDPDDDPLVYTITHAPTHGTLSGDGANLTYTPAGLYHGADQFEFSVTDGSYASTAVVDITVNEVDLAPTAHSQTVAGHTNIAATFALTGSDPKGLPLTYRLTSLPAHGTLSGTVPGNVIYTPTQYYTGTDALTFVANNGVLDSAPATVTINLAKDLQNGPTVQDDYVEGVYSGEVRTIDVLANDSDFYNDPLEIVAVTDPGFGSVAIAADHKSVVYTAGTVTNSGYAIFQYSVSNGSPDIRTATVFVKLVNQNLVVNSTQDSGPGTLRDALATIQGSSRPQDDRWKISFAQGLRYYPITLTTSDPGDPGSALLVTGNVNIVTNLSPLPVIQVNPGGVALRAFHVVPGATLRLNGVTITGGQAHLGGAILNEGTLSVEQSVLTANTAFAVEGDPGTGGAIYTTGALNLVNTALTGNVADVAGGFYQLGNGTPATTVVKTATLSGHGAAGDFRSVAINGGTASIDATALTTETPTAPWFGALPAAQTIAHAFIAKLPVLTDGDAYTLTVSSSNPDLSNVAWTGRGLTRTLTLGGFNPTAGQQTRLTATATDGSVSYVQHTDITVDPAAAQTPVAVDDGAAVLTSGSVLIPVLANDYDPDGGALTLVSVTPPDGGGSATIENNQVRFTHDGDYSAFSYGFAYTVRNAAGRTATANVTIRRVESYTQPIYSNADSGDGTLRDAIALANGFYAPGGWTLGIDGAFAYYNDGTTVLASTAGDHGVGDSAFLVTGDVTIDASALPGFTIQRDANGPTMRLFRVTDTGRLKLRGVVLDGGAAGHGGVVLNEGALILDHSTVQNGSAELGGGVFNEGTLAADTATLTQNTAASYGGALYNRNGSANIAGSTLSNNVAIDGGGVGLFGDNALSLLRLADATVNNPGAAHDLSANVNGSGTTVLTAAGATSVAAPGDTWVNPIADRTMNDTASVPFTFTAPATATLRGQSRNEAVVPTNGLAITGLTANAGTLQVQASSSGYAPVDVLAFKGATAFGQSFLLTVHAASNQPPVAVDDAVTLYQGAQTTVDVLANDYDPEGASLSLQSVGRAAHGTVSISGSVVVYTHDGSDTTTDAFTYVVADGFGGTATGTVHVTLQAAQLAITTTDSGGGVGSLRAAMEFAAAHPGPTWKIVFDPSIPANSTLYYGNYGPYYNGYTMFHVAGNVLLDGSQVPGLRIESSGGQYSPPVRFFHVLPGATLELRSLVLTKGVVQVTGAPEEGLGGGGVVLNEGTFVARDVTFLNNRAPGNVGGAISSSGSATVVGCTFTGNTATAGTDRSARGLGTGLGGAIYQLNGTLTVVDSTFTDNDAPDGASLHVAGDVAHAETTLTRCTLGGQVATSSQVTLAATNGGTVTRNGSQNALPMGEDAPWIGSSAGTISLDGPADLAVTLGVPTTDYTVSASASPAASMASLGLTGSDADRTLSVVPASGVYGPVNLTVTLVNGPLTVNETFPANIVAPTPTAPTGLSARAVSDSQILLTWTDRATNETGYSVERSANGVDAWTVVTSALAPNTTSYVDAGLDAATTQFYRVRCHVADSASDPSDIAGATTSAALGDGIPGWWRYRYFGDGTRIVPGAEFNADPDGDGLANWQEFLAGTDPTDPASALRATLTRSGANPVISFPSIAGRTYQIEVASDLGASAAWTVLADNLVGTGAVMSYTDMSAGSAPSRFYRVVVHP